MRRVQCTANEKGVRGYSHLFFSLSANQYITRRRGGSLTEPICGLEGPLRLGRGHKIPLRLERRGRGR